MTKIDQTTKFEAEHAARSFARLEADARARCEKAIDAARSDLHEAACALQAGRTPNACGILQTRATDVEMAIGRLAAIREAAPLVNSLWSVFNAAAAAAERD